MTQLNGSIARQPARLDWADTARGIGIFLVVLGHVLIGMRAHQVASSSRLDTLVLWIYAFHMPLFFFLGGLFIERAVARPFFSFFVNRLQVLAYPYFVWSIIQESIRIQLGQSHLPFSEMWRIVYLPTMQFWFLYALFVISIAYAVLRKARLPIMVIFLAAATLHATRIPDLSLGPWTVLYEVRSNVVYFAAAALIGPSGLQSALAKVGQASLRRIALAGYAVVLLAVECLWTIQVAIVPVIAAFGIGATIALAQYLTAISAARVLQTWGRLSLQIFVAHSIASAGIRILLAHHQITNPAVHILLGTGTGLLLPLALWWLTERLGCPWVFTLRRPGRVERPD